MAGSRFKYLSPKIKFGYKELVEAIGDAIDMAEQVDGAVVVEHQESNSYEALDFDKVQGEAREIWTKLVEEDEDNARKILKKLEITFGRPIKLSEITEDQVDLLYLAVLDMRDMAEAQGIK